MRRNSVGAGLVATLVVLIGAWPARGQQVPHVRAGDVVVRGGGLFDPVAGEVVPNPGILVRNGVFLAVGLDPNATVPDDAVTPDSIRREVDLQAGLGARGFKAKGLRAGQLAALIDQAHHHGLSVTAHLDSGFRRSVNPKEAILLGIDRVDLVVVGGDPLADITATRDVILVMKAGRIHDPAGLLRSVEGRLGPEAEAGADWWKGSLRFRPLRP